jgi:hypothetical protein
MATPERNGGLKTLFRKKEANGTMPDQNERFGSNNIRSQASQNGWI